jgi:UDP-3-O-[3-hydroxymyristoyl] N-acetylglucosamine deacetylase
VQQTTIARAVEWRGIGLHSGRPATVRVLPAPVDTGLVFVALDAGPSAAPIPVRPDAVVSTDRAMVLAGAGAGGAECAPGPRVATVEHLLAALYALGLHNARIEVTGGELPVLDGSALPFVTRLRRAGRRLLGAARRELEVTGVLRIGDERRWIQVEPAEGLEIDYSIEFEHPFVGRQGHALTVDADAFETALAPARTFGFADEV